MAVDPITAALSLGESVMNRIWPDANKRAEEMRKLQELADKKDLYKLNAQVSLLLKQAEINLADAKSGSRFQAWWRPAIGWTGAISLFLMYVPKACVMTYIWTYQALTILQQWDGAGNLHMPAFPDLGATDIIGLLGSLLGIAAMRSYDKLNKTDTKL